MVDVDIPTYPTEMNVDAAEWQPKPIPSVLPVVDVMPPLSFEEHTKALAAIAASINAAASNTMLDSRADASQSHSFVNLPDISGMSLDESVSASLPPAAEQEDDEANLDEIEAAIAAAEVEAFLDSKGACNIPTLPVLCVRSSELLFVISNAAMSLCANYRSL